MEETYLLNVEGVRKKILHGGQGELPKFQDGSKHTGMYALVSRGMRRIAEGRDPLEGQKHRCGMGNMFDYHSTGYDDLDELQRTPQPLIFIMELFRVEEPSAYKRDTWAMSKEEKLAAVPILHSEGNRLVLRKEFAQAAAKYQEAVICLRNLQAKEKPWEDGWLKLENLVTPLVLNYCQCQLELGEYYEVLEHTTELLQKHNDNAKAYFKRAKAHAAVWNEREAREDFMRVAHLDPSMAAAVKKELKQLGERMRKKHVEDRKRYQGLFQPARGPRASGGQESGEVGDRAMLQEEVPQGEAGVLESPGQGAEQPAADKGPSGARCEEAEPGAEAAQGQPAEKEVEVRDGTELGEETNLGTCRAEPESGGAERGSEKEEEKKKIEEEKVEEEDEKKEKVVEAEEEEEVKEEYKKKEKEVEEEDEKEEKVEEVKEEYEKREKEEVEEEEKKKEEEEEKEEEKEEKSPAVVTEKLAVGQGLEEGAGGAEGDGPGTRARAEPGTAPEPGPPSEELGEGDPELEDETPREVLEEGTHEDQQAGGSRGDAEEGSMKPDNFTSRSVLQAGHLGPDEELGRDAEVPPGPTAVREGADAPPGQCNESRELEAITLGHGQLSLDGGKAGEPLMRRHSKGNGAAAS
ncbi:golgin subfamily A member 6-like protein 6 isoform X3 [Cuculus canorus]|uniref:golgin subfamily A member 6-like protein 6 isoform X3 n=1 Tax=Cuculus canorus TaxID=55661 RepID=UPI0023AB20B5|nr:golgin subfamily A member 6-like protein 6 isoform X3 [Cuculus canorus]